MESSEEESTSQTEDMEIEFDHTLTAIQDHRSDFNIDKILEFLPHHDLLNLRLINSNWNNCISTYLLKKETGSVTFNFSYEKGNYYSAKLKSKTLSDLFDCLANSKLFPCNNFSFIGGIDFTQKNQAWVKSFNAFLFAIGPQIKRLEISNPTLMDSYLDLDIDMDEDNFDLDMDTFFQLDKAIDDDLMRMDIPTLQAILLRLAPNIETLELAYLNHQLWNDTSRLILPKLRNLTCLHEGNSSTIFDLLGHAPQLKSVQNFKLQYIDQFLSNHSIRVIKKLGQNQIESVDDLHNFMVFAKAQPQLECLVLPMVTHKLLEYNQDFVSAIISILESSKDTLQSMKITTLDFDIQIPQLKRLKKLEIFTAPIAQQDFVGMKNQRIFPLGMNITYIFPNVESVRWSFNLAKQIEWNILLPVGSFVGNLGKVKYLLLESADLGNDICLGKISTLIPKVTELTVKDSQENLSKLSVIYRHYPKLKLICLQDDFGYLQPLMSDSSLSGIPRHICSHLFELYMSMWEYNLSFNNIKQFTGLTDFQELECFKIILNNRDWTEKNLTRLSLPTWVSGVRGFYRYCDKIRVIIGYNHNCPTSSKIKTALGSVTPYANIIHKVI